jgi:hypothetical protein
MRVAALMPTCDRATTAHRAASTFLTALSRLPQVESATLVIADDSSQPKEADLLRCMAAGLTGQHSQASVRVVRTAARPAPTVAAPGGGPGAVRNRGLTALRQVCPEADLTIMFDDDVAFADVAYRGIDLCCDGTRLLRDALDGCTTRRTIAGCGYIGRQDLSILEHARLACGPLTTSNAVEPAVERADVANVAPGGISTAFLAIAGPPSALPNFPEHYNEDYVWLHAFERAGWPLRRVAVPLIHAPPGDVQVTATGLSFQIHGEIVWLAVLERARFSVGNPLGMAAAVDEIAGDIRNALANPDLAERQTIAATLSEVLDHYQAIGRQLSSRQPGSEAARLVDDIRRGLALRP